MSAVLKTLGKSALRRFGLEVRRLQKPGTALRPVGDLASLLADLLARGLVCRTIFDVGASDGRWTRTAREVYPNATFVLVEPRSTMRRGLDEMCAADSRCRVIAAAAGPTAGQAMLTDWDTASTLLDVGPLDAPKERVQVVTLDGLSEQFGVPQLLKLDVEGFEIEVLRGGGDMLNAVDVVILEASLFRFAPNPPMFHEVVAFMAEKEFFAYDFAGFMRRPFDGAVGLLDVCFVRRTSSLRGSESWT